jgi:hypothetical protein
MHETLQEMKAHTATGADNQDILQNFMIYKELHRDLSRSLGTVVSH